LHEVLEAVLVWQQAPITASSGSTVKVCEKEKFSYRISDLAERKV